MPRYFLTRLRVEGFRGINNEGDPLDLKFTKDAVNSVFAVNANGKSSLFDALSYAFKGSIPRLSILQAQERPGDYYCNRFHSLKQATIELELTPDDGTPSIEVKVERNAEGQRKVSSTTGHANPEALLASLAEDFSLLDYRTFSRFIDDTPLERGRAFSSLLGLSAYSDLRQSLQAVSDTRSLNSDLEISALNGAATSAQRAVQHQLAILRTSYEYVIGKTLDDLGRLDEYTAEIVTALGGVEMLTSHFTGKALLDIDFDVVKQTIRDAEGGEQRRELDKAIAEIAAIEGLGLADDATFQAEQTAIHDLLTARDTQLASTRGDLFKRLHDAADTFLASGAWPDEKQCPLCDSGLETPIAEHVKAQLSQYQQVAETTKDIGERWQIAAWVQRLKALENSAVLALPEAERQAEALGREVTAGCLSIERLDMAVERLAALDSARAKRLTALRARKDQLEKELPQSLVRLTEQVEYGRQFKDALVSYRVHQAEEKTARARLAIREKWERFIKNASKVYGEAEMELSKTRITAIETEYKDMFKRIMNVSDIVPALRRDDGREDLHVELSDFHGLQALSARALLSESFRNALAISVFLAAAIKHVGAPRFIVFDDVTSSFDSGHQFNLMELLRTSLQFPRSAQGLQFILLSHDGLLEKYFDRLGTDAGNGWRHYKLQGAPPMGTILSQSQDTNRLKTTLTKLLSAGQTAQAEPLIRQYLEFKLQQIIRKVDIPVPIDFAMKDHSRMVQNCLDAIKAAVSLHKAANRLILEESQIQNLETVHVPALLGNWVSHYETASGTSLSIPMLQSVVQTIDDLSECFRYDDMTAAPYARKWYRSLSSR